MKNLIITLTLLGTLTSLGQNTRFGLVELSDRYEREISDLNDGNSCSVRLLASYFDISYYDAYEQMEKFGRVHGKGASITKIIRAFNRMQEDTFVSQWTDVSEKTGKKNGMLLQDFLNTEAEENTDYILVMPGHITWLKVGEMSKNGKGLLNTLYGNEKDRAKRILVYIPINKR